MKKTLIAAGIAAVVAAPAAFAEVKISGVVEQTFVFNENGGTTASSDNALTFSASEDLGNGLTAFASIMLDTDNDSSATTANTNNSSKNEVVGLKGSFGTLMTGRMEGFGISKITSQMTTLGAGSAGGDGSTTPEGMMKGLDTRSAYNNGVIAYVSPTVNGLHAGVAQYANTDKEIALFYDNGPLSLKFAHIDLNNGTTNDYSQQLASASYKMGDFKGTVVMNKQEVAAGTTDGTDMGYRLDYTMGNNTISLLYTDGEDTAGNDNGDSTVVELHHKLSKRTGIYADYLTYDNNTTSTDSVSVGLYHKF